MSRGACCDSSKALFGAVDHRTLFQPLLHALHPHDKTPSWCLPFALVAPAYLSPETSTFLHVRNILIFPETTPGRSSM